MIIFLSVQYMVTLPYIKLNLIWWYGCYYIKDDFMYVGVAWVRPGLIAEYIRLTLIWWYVCYYVRNDFMYFT